MKFRIAMLLLALAAILVAAGCNDSDYSADAADSAKAVETVNASTDTGVAPPATNPCAADVEDAEGKSCEGGCCAAKEGADKTACTECANAEGGVCEHCKAESKEGVETTDASHEHAEGESCCGTCGGAEGKKCEDCDGSCENCPKKDGVETTDASHKADACPEGCECEGCKTAA
ncbi:hypothetical protein KDL44_10260 [bacterium]|nr:hypothetical protein [bacterium]